MNLAELPLGGPEEPMTTPTRDSAATERRRLEPVVTGEFPRSPLTDCLLFCGLAGGEGVR